VAFSIAARARLILARISAFRPPDVAGVEFYRELPSLVKDKSVVLEEYATRMVAAEAGRIREMELMLVKRAPD
jgi:hypothetical protein